MENMRFWIDCVNIIAVITSPLIAVWVSQLMASRNKAREDKMKLFSVLMSNRIYIWSQEMVNAYNMIDIVFYDDIDVLEAWHELYNLLNKRNTLSDEEVQEIAEKKYRLLETMAKSLGYTKKYDWNFVRTTYMPIAMQNEINNQELYKQQQLEILKKMLENHVISDKK